MSLCQETLTKNTIQGTDFHGIPNNPENLDDQGLSFTGAQNTTADAGNRFPTLVLYSDSIISQLVIVSFRKLRSRAQNTDSHNHRDLASQGPGLFLPALTSKSFLSPLFLLFLWILACQLGFCNTFPLLFPAAPLFFLLWDMQPKFLE